jgi:putative ribosome biogenesis GTPase RsgA
VLRDGGLLIEMPGMREMGMLGASEGIEKTFADISALELGCRYPDCRHGPTLEGQSIRPVSTHLQETEGRVGPDQ